MKITADHAIKSSTSFEAELSRNDLSATEFT